MRLKKIHITSFRNIASAEITTGERFNIIHGKNAQGKTNLLESIFMLGTMKSFKPVRNNDLIKWGSKNAVIKGSVDRNDVSREITLVIDAEGKKARIDNKPLTKLTDFFGSLNVVVFSPEELGMVKGMPEGRRRYLDRAIFSSDVTYLSKYLEYGKILKQRNIVLKNRDLTSLEIWSEKLAETGVTVISRRKDYVAQINPLLIRHYQEISGSDEQANIRYLPHRLSSSRETIEAADIMEAYKRVAADEARFGSTLIGPHRDDIEFTLDGKPVRIFASQGQQRTFVLALKMAEIDWLHQQFNHPPIMLLDDMTSELDEERNRNLMTFLNKMEMQVFITTTTLHNINLQEIEDCMTFRMEEGTVIN